MRPRKTLNTRQSRFIFYGVLVDQVCAVTPLASTSRVCECVPFNSQRTSAAKLSCECEMTYMGHSLNSHLRAQFGLAWQSKSTGAAHTAVAAVLER